MLAESGYLIREYDKSNSERCCAKCDDTAVQMCG